LLQSGVREFQLRLDTGGSSQLALVCLADEEIKQRGLADAGLATQYEDLTTTGQNRSQYVIQLLALALPASQADPIAPVGRHARSRTPAPRPWRGARTSGSTVQQSGTDAWVAAMSPVRLLAEL
jgi:hypothetical protein